jgi:hypothetical protein
MRAIQRGPWPADELEVASLRAAERERIPLLLCRTGDGTQRILRLLPDPGRVTVGRAPINDVSLDWDPAVSRAHAVVELVGGVWAVLDAGLSRNGTFVNGERVQGQRPLRHSDAVRVGNTLLVFWCPTSRPGETTVSDVARLPAPHLTPAQLAVLRALCRPSLGPALTPPAGNERIAAELSLTASAVKAHLRILYQKFGIAGLPQAEKRIRLVALAVEAGLVGRP